ncbi:hypothetical protein AB6805_18590 [Chitinophaga sp. RCC_12]|uniref:hypothetical protein n=1 Tax=Chitinophaga sp. RCC_12 TaxID=3239226 RepID=UPI0035251D09
METTVEDGYQPDGLLSKGGNLAGKKFMVRATWNAPAEAFDNPGNKLFEGKGLSDIFLPITSNYRFCGYEL